MEAIHLLVDPYYVLSTTVLNDTYVRICVYGFILPF